MYENTSTVYTVGISLLQVLHTWVTVAYTTIIIVSYLQLYNSLCHVSDCRLSFTTASCELLFFSYLIYFESFIRNSDVEFFCVTTLLIPKVYQARFTHALTCGVVSHTPVICSHLSHSFCFIRIHSCTPSHIKPPSLFLQHTTHDERVRALTDYLNARVLDVSDEHLIRHLLAGAGAAGAGGHPMAYLNDSGELRYLPSIATAASTHAHGVPTHVSGTGVHVAKK